MAFAPKVLSFDIDADPKAKRLLAIAVAKWPSGYGARSPSAATRATCAFARRWVLRRCWDAGEVLYSDTDSAREQTATWSSAVSTAVIWFRQRPTVPGTCALGRDGGGSGRRIPQGRCVRLQPAPHVRHEQYPAAKRQVPRWRRVCAPFGCREAHADRSGTSSVRMPAVPLGWKKATPAASPPGRLPRSIWRRPWPRRRAASAATSSQA